MTDTITHETELPVDIPGLGPALVAAGCGFYRIMFGHGDRAPLVLFGKSYRDDVTVYVDADDGIMVDISQYTSFTDAARRAIDKAVYAWATTWTTTDEARRLLVATVAHHNRINEDTLRSEIERATNHLRELEMLAERLRAAEPDEYVSPWETTYRLTEKGR